MGQGKQFWTQVLVAVLVFEVTSLARAEDELREGVIESARKIGAVMKSVGAESASVLGFEDRTTLGATVLSGLEQMLTDELKKEGITVRSNGGSVGVKGFIKAAQEFEGGGARFLRLELQLFDKFGEPLHTLTTQIDNPNRKQDGAQDAKSPNAPPDLDSKFDIKSGAFNQDFRGMQSDGVLLAAFGGNVDLNSGARDAFDALTDTIDLPTAVIASDGVSAKASDKSPFAVRIVSAGRAKPLRLIAGQPFVDLENGEKFKLEIQNDATFRTEATITLDGINSFRFSRLRRKDGTPRYTSWILGRGSHSILGWHLDNDTAQEFKATSYEKSKLRELGLAKTPVGAVTVVFRSVWKTGSDAPPDEDAYLEKTEMADGTIKYSPRERTRTKIVSKQVFIGGGGEVSQHVEEARENEIGRIRGVVTIRYRHPMAE